MRSRNFLLLLVAGANAFAPASLPAFRQMSGTRISLMVDPFHSFDLYSAQEHVTSFGQMLSTITISDAADTIDVVETVSAVDAKDVVENAVADGAKKSDAGWFGFLTGPIKLLLVGIHSFVSAFGSSNSWGISIVALTMLIKLATFPLNKSQLESTNKMQAMQPAVKEIQTKYQSNPEVMNQKIAEFYQINEINPLAGCIPSLLQIPIFIGLYRAVLDLADENKLTEPFLFLPSLEGPTFGADPASGSDWLLKGWVDGAPSLGWDDTLAYLVLPIFLVISQYVSMELMQPKSDDPAQQQSNAVLKVLPVLIGWFSLNVPSALCVYWVVNNIVTTATTLFIRNSMPKVTLITPDRTGAASMPPPPPTIFAPPREKPAGFGEPVQQLTSKDAVQPITSIDAVIVENDEEPEGQGSSPATESRTSSKRRPKRKKNKSNS